MHSARVGGYRPGVGVLWSRGERKREREQQRERERESSRERERMKEIPGRNYVCGRCRLKSNGVQLNMMTRNILPGR